MKVIGNLTKDAIIRAAVSEGISVTQEIGSSVTFESATVSFNAVVYDSSNQKIVIAYRDQGNSNYGTAIVGTVSGSSISFGTPAVFSSATTGYISGAFDSNNNKVVFCFRGSSNYGRSVVGTVSGTSISFGSIATFESATIEDTGTAYDANAQRIVVAYRDDGNTFRGTAAVGTVSGTSISFGTPVVYDTGPSVSNTAIYDSTNNKIVIAYQESSTGQAIVGTVSGTSISFGTAATFESGNCNYISGDYDSVNQKIVLAYQDSGNSSYGTAVVGTVSGTSISFGTPVVFNEGNSGYFSTTFDSGAGRILITGSDDSNSSKGEAYVGTVSGTSITFEDMVLFKDASADYIASAYDANQGRVVIAYRSPSNSNYGEAVVFKIGYSQATGGTIADGSAVIVNTNGTVSSISQTANSESLGSTVNYNSSSSNFASACYDSANGKIVVIYRDGGNGGAGTYIVGTISGQSISYGSEATFESGQTQWTSTVYDPVNAKIVVAYQDQDDSFYGKVIVGTLSGTTITWGTPVVFHSGETTYISAVYHTAESKVVVTYYDGGSPSGQAIVGTVSGNSISFGSIVTYDGGSGIYNAAVYDPVNEKVIVAFRASSSIGTARVLTVSGTSVTAGSRQSYITNGQANQNEIAYDSASGKIVIVMRDEANTAYGSAFVGTVSGDTITYASRVTFQSGSVDWMGIRGFSGGGVILVYDDIGDGSQKVTLKYGTISGTTITFSSGTQLETSGTVGGRAYALAEDTANEKMFIGYSHSSTGKSRIYNPTFNSTNLTTENFVGFMDGAALDGTNGEILSSCSIARNQTSLTAGQTYFVTPAGTLSLTAGSPSVTAGTAISSTELIVKG